MSHTGKLIRGLKYYSQRRADGALPLDIAEDEAKMADVNYYLDFTKNRNVKSVDKMLINIRYLNRNPVKNRLKRLSAAKEVLNNIPEEEPVEETPEEPVEE